MRPRCRIQTTGPNNGHQLRDYSKSCNRPENHPLIYTVQQKQIDQLCNKYRLSPDQRKELHRIIHGEGYGYKEIEEIIKGFLVK